MYIACPSCHRQYDVGDMAPESKVRCFCGVVGKVPSRRARQVQMLHCSHCGGRLEHGATSCGYCEAEVTLGHKGLGETCPECFARMVKGASYCSTCGVAIEPQVLRPLESTRCPRCEGQLALCETPGGAFTECTSCGGLWITEDFLQKLTAEHDKRAAAGLVPGAWKAGGETGGVETKVRYLKCPECGNMMNRRNFGQISGVVIDWCRGHGFWFDNDELERALAFIDDGGLERSRDRKHQRALQELRTERARAESAQEHARRIRRRFGRGPDAGMFGALADLLRLI